MRKEGFFLFLHDGPFEMVIENCCSVGKTAPFFLIWQVFFHRKLIFFNILWFFHFCLPIKRASRSAPEALFIVVNDGVFISALPL